MKLSKFKVNNLQDLVTVFGVIKTYDWSKPLEVSYGEYEEDRGLTQNALSHVWYRQYQKHRGDVELYEASGELKLDFAVPVLLSENEDFQKLYKYCLAQYPRETQVEILGKSFCKSTSLFTKKQFTEYLSSVQTHCSKLGIYLEAQGEYEEIMMRQYS